MVPQKRRLLAIVAPDRRRIRRMADARPVTDVVVDRFIMLILFCAFWRAVIAEDAMGCAAPLFRSQGHDQAGNDDVLSV